MVSVPMQAPPINMHTVKVKKERGAEKADVLF